MLYQMILFDLDDTLIDFAHSERMGLAHIYNQFYTPIEYALFEQLYQEINTHLWNQVGHSLSSSDVRLQRFTHLNQKLGYSASVIEIAKEYEKNMCTHAHWLPHVKAAIEFLHQKGHVLGIITNGFIETQAPKYQQLELYNWFDCYIISSDIGVAKPNAKIFEIAVAEITSKRQYTIAKQSMLMVGDSMISDGHGAMNFGIDFCFINNHSLDALSAAPVKYTISSVAHLPITMGYKAEYELFLDAYNSITI